MLVLIVAAVTADALGSYAAGRLSGGGGWAAGLAEGRQPAAVRPLPADLTPVLAQEISGAEHVGWQRRQPNAAY
jgi:hypothetical protein